MSNVIYFPYGEREIEYLSGQDKRLGAWMAQVGHIDRVVTPDLFTSLLHCIVGQQCSGKAAETVWGRFALLVGEVTPERVAAFSEEEIQRCGMSFRKAGNIRTAAARMASGELRLDDLPIMSDEEVCARLTTLPGVGVWTAQMLMIFSLCRPDVLSYDDLGIRRGLCRLYGHKTLTKEQFARYQKRYSPYASVASFYLWEFTE